MTETLARETLKYVMMDALSNSGAKPFAVKAVCLGVSGVNHPKDQEWILDWLRFNLHISHFIRVAALASGSMGKLHGCVLIAGIGSIAYCCYKDGEEARAAGGGPILGDWVRQCTTVYTVASLWRRKCSTRNNH
ncbi:hypothetical protein CTI12_AA571360 [Artemisia annua]|uniref:N-acetylglucosamine kinase n=1 Tax=Artemisia annua TaxID=35608 RepID=A0A2U1KRY2_ARTAN|nr:hypothetical protein CTI12_AA571360 [Artemisia annua]